jgi:TonB-linked SusC/RagA family outer membrane protein
MQVLKKLIAGRHNSPQITRVSQSYNSSAKPATSAGNTALPKLAAMALLILGSLSGSAQNINPNDLIVVGKQYPDAVVVTGTVTDAATGKKLSGIHVNYKDYSAAISDSTGSFSLRVPSYNVSIVLEGDGFQSKEIALRGQTAVKAAMYEDNFPSVFDQVTEPFGTKLKSHSTSSITSVSGTNNWARTNETPATYLQGRVPGLNAIRRSGTPNIGASLWLRGITSLYATNQPLIVVDGVLYNNQDHGGSIIANHYTDPLSTLDVRDIDNITVLKDGSSLYGTKGANGVILITTARARELGTRIDFAIYTGIASRPDRLPVMNATDYRTYLSDLLKSKGLSDAAIQALPYMNDDPNNPDYHKYHNNTDWQKEVMTKSALSKNVFLKVTGGDNIARYALSLGYMKADGLTRNTDLSRYNMRFNADLNLSRKLTASSNLSFTFNEQNLRDQGNMPKTNPLFVALVKSPLLRIRDVSASGVESPSLADRDTFNTGNPIVLTDVTQGVNKNYRFFGTIGFNYALTKWINISTTFGVTNDKVRENFFVPRKGVTNDTLSTDVAFSRLGSQVNSFFSLYNDTRVAYARRFKNKHELAARLGVRYLFNKTEQDYGLGFNSAIDELVSVGNGVNGLRRIGGATGESNWLSTYVNADYNFLDKYFLSFNVSIDGSSRFGKDIPEAFTFNGNKYAVLPSIAGAWLVSSEKFFTGKLFDLLKLRASFGITGNDDIGNYTTRQTYISQNLLGVQGLVRGGFGNSQLQWEKVRKINLGLDAAVLNERISISFDVFQHRTSKMIAYEALPVATGFPYAITNDGGMTTKGFELALNGRVLNKTDWKVDLGITLGKYRSTIDHLPSDNVLTNFGGATYITSTGKGPNLFYGYKTNGLFITDAAAGQAGLSVRKTDGTLAPFTGGDIHFADLNGDHIIDENDRQVIGDPNPDLFGSGSARVTWKKFTLDALLTFIQGNDVFNYTRQQLESMSGYANQTDAIRNRWRTNGHQTGIPKATWNDPMGNSRFSDRWIEDGSYLRLRTISLSYHHPFKDGFMKYLDVYVTGNNVLTLTKYKGYDPEFSATESIFGQGVDNTLEPLTRSLLLGLRIGL